MLSFDAPENFLFQQVHTIVALIHCKIILSSLLIFYPRLRWGNHTYLKINITYSYTRIVNKGTWKYERERDIEIVFVFSCRHKRAVSSHLSELICTLCTEKDIIYLLGACKSIYILHTCTMGHFADNNNIIIEVCTTFIIYKRHFIFSLCMSCCSNCREDYWFYSTVCFIVCLCCQQFSFFPCIQSSIIDWEIQSRKWLQQTSTTARKIARAYSIVHGSLRPPNRHKTQDPS